MIGMAKQITSNVSGVVMRIMAKEGQVVSMDQDVLAVESMKMEMIVPANASGTVKKCLVAVEEFIQEGQAIFEIE